MFHRLSLVLIRLQHRLKHATPPLRLKSSPMATLLLYWVVVWRPRGSLGAGATLTRPVIEF